MSFRYFLNGPLRDAAVLGAVSARSVRVWARVQIPGTVRATCGLVGSEERRAEVFTEANDENATDQTVVLVMGGLEPMQRYWFRVNRADSGALVGEGTFETGPESTEESPRKFSIGLASCHQPFQKDGSVRENAREMLRATRRCFRENDTKMAFFVGDQMYTDFPTSMSLYDQKFFPNVAPPGRERVTDCSTDEVRRLLHERYRHFWNLPEWIALQAEVPCYLTWDDHEIIDNWGSSPEHQEPLWASVGEGARLACHDYQMSRVMSWQSDRGFQYPVDYGPVSTFMADMRSERRGGENGRIFSDEQKADLVEFLKTRRDQAAIFLGLSVPPIHLPRKLTKSLSWLTPMGNDFDDRWSTWADARDRDWLMRTLRDHQRENPKQHVVILSGDIHIGCAHAVVWEEDRGLRLHQLISSGLTHKVNGFIAAASKFLIGANRVFETEKRDLSGQVELVRGTDNARENPVGKLNIGLVEIETRDDGGTDLQFKLFSQKDGKPVLEFESDRIRGEA
ncbi:MAG: alkaline phosphatase D family protein [Chthoniobacterales bacterium]